jgi:hypothetical protein
MIARNLHRLKVEKSSHCLTSFAGLPLLTELAHQTGLITDLDAIPGIWERQGQYSTSDYVMGLAMTLVAGGEGLDDTRILRSDPGLAQLAFANLPAANSWGDFLRRFTNRSLHHLGAVVRDQALLNCAGFKTLTLDIDSSVIESHKEAAKMSYQKVPGYNPVLAWLAEPDVFLGGVFRDGNASPQCNLTSLLRYCHRMLPEGIDLRVRTDSAAYRLDFIDYCHRRAKGFTITADLDAAVMESIENIPEKAWQLVVKNDDTFLLAETIHVPGGCDNRYKLPAFRLVVKRWLSGQLELFEPVIKHYAVLTDFPESWSAKQVLDHHNDRGRAEKAIGELKNGYGLDKLPCGQLFANAAFFQVGLIAYNLVQTFKRFALPEGWKKFCIKNLRFRLLCQAAIIVRHAHRLVIKLSEAFPFFEVFENARWAVLSPVLAT